MVLFNFICVPGNKEDFAGKVGIDAGLLLTGFSVRHLMFLVLLAKYFSFEYTTLPPSCPVYPAGAKSVVICGVGSGY